MNRSEAFDLIDTYGTDARRWPKGVKSEIDALRKSDKEFAAHFKEQKELDKLLNNWDEDQDGVEIDDDDDGESVEHDASGGHSGRGKPSLKSDGGEEGGELDSSYDASETSGSSVSKADITSEETPRKFDWDFTEADFEELDDTDSLLSAAIAKTITESVCGEYYTFTTQYDTMPEIQVKETGRDRFGNTHKISTDRLDNEVREATGVLQNNLQRLIVARTRAILSPGFRSGKLHGASLHRLSLGDDRLFRRKQEAKAINTAITLLIDCSGSMVAEVTRGKRRIDLAIQSAYAMSQVLSKIGVDFEVLGFSAKSQTGLTGAELEQYNKDLEAVVASGVTVTRYYPLVHPMFKAFNESFTPNVARRFASAQADVHGQLCFQQNVDGESLRFAARRLLKQEADRHILIVLSDGQPCSWGGLTGKGAAYIDTDKQLHHDLINAVKEITKAKVEVLGIGMGYEGVKHYYPNNEIIRNVADLPKALMKQLSKMLLGN